MSWHTLRYTVGMNTDGAMMPTVETNLETVRNPTEFIRGRMSVFKKRAGNPRCLRTEGCHEWEGGGSGQRHLLKPDIDEALYERRMKEEKAAQDPRIHGGEDFCWTMSRSLLSALSTSEILLSSRGRLLNETLRKFSTSAFTLVFSGMRFSDLIL